MKYKLLLPSHIVVKDGLACGDRITLLYDFENKYMHFQFISEGCIYCRATCEYLQRELNHHKADEVFEKTRDMITNIKINHGFIGDILRLSVDRNRVECCLSSLILLNDSANEFEPSIYNTRNVDLYVDKLDCDACAVRENVSWLYQKPSYIHGQYWISEDKRRKLMRLGRVAASDFSYEESKELYFSLDETDFEFIEEYKLYPMIYQNLNKMGIISPGDERWRLLIYQRQRTEICYKEVNVLDAFLKSNKYKASWVKGAYTKKMYKDPLMRNLTDFDLLVLDEDEAFLIIEWMLQHGYSIFPDSFSLKKVCQDGKNIYTGHIHFQKILNMQFRLIVDVSFTGFPMIRVASYKPSFEDGVISIESMIVVTLCHLFKHKEVFIKDINDLYVMLTSNAFNVKKLFKEICYNNMEEFLRIVVKFISQEYQLPDEENFFFRIKSMLGEPEIDIAGWPYNENIVKDIKQFEFTKYFKNYDDETDRKYLYPVLIYCGKIDTDTMIDKVVVQSDFELMKYNKISDTIFEVKVDLFWFALSPIGWFLIMKDYYCEEMKPRIIEILNTIERVGGEDMIDIPYAIAFEDNWIEGEV